MLWSALKDAYLQTVRLHGGTRHVERAMDVLGRFTKYMDPFEVRDCTESMLVEFMIRRKKDPGRKSEFLSPASLNCDLRYLNHCFKFAAERFSNDQLGVSEYWKPPRLKRFKEPKRMPRALSTDAIDRLFAACEKAHLPKLTGIPAPDFWRAFWAVAYSTGLRCKALLEVRMPSESELAENTMPLPAESDKCFSDRSTVLMPFVVPLIRKLGIPAGNLLFPWPCGRRWFYATVHKFQDKAGIPRGDHALPHDLRRTKATNMIKLGASLPVVQRQMGHASPEITARLYVGQVTKEERDFVNRMPEPANKGKPSAQREFAFS